MQCGDILLVEGEGWPDGLIRFGQSLRPATRPFRTFTHTALITSQSGDLIEAVLSGVRRSHISAHAAAPTRIVPINASAEDRAEIVAYASAQVGRQYGALGIVSVVLSLLTGGGLDFTLDGTSYCSQLCAEALEHGGWIFPCDTSRVTPALLASLLGA